MIKSYRTRWIPADSENKIKLTKGYTFCCWHPCYKQALVKRTIKNGRIGNAIKPYLSR